MVPLHLCPLGEISVSQTIGHSLMQKKCKKPKLHLGFKDDCNHDTEPFLYEDITL